jgi:hypothetical protein
VFKAEPRLLFGTPCWELEVSTPHQGCVCPCSLFAPEPETIIQTLALAAGAVLVFESTGKAAALHGYCCGSGQCVDNGTNSPTSNNPPTDFGFTASPSMAGDLLVNFLFDETTRSWTVKQFQPPEQKHEEDNVFGTPTGNRIDVNKGDPRRPASRRRVACSADQSLPRTNPHLDPFRMQRAAARASFSAASLIKVRCACSSTISRASLRTRNASALRSFAELIQFHLHAVALKLKLSKRLLSRS